MDTPMSLINERVSELCGLMACMKQEMAEMRECLGGLRADVTWLKKSFWLLASIAGSALAGGVAAVLLRCK